MEIKIRQKKSKRTLSNTRFISAKLVDDTIVDLDAEFNSIVWSFEVVSSPVNSNPVYHSSDSEEGTFLNYFSKIDPDLALVFETEGVYEIKVLCQTHQFETQTRIAKSLDDNGNLVEEEYEGIFEIINDYKSAVLELIYENETDGEWV